MLSEPKPFGDPTRATFLVGRRYRVRRPFAGYDALAVGDVLVFVGGGQFSPYDDAWMYDFRCERDGSPFCWLLHDTEPAGRQVDDFEELGPQP